MEFRIWFSCPRAKNSWTRQVVVVCLPYNSCAVRMFGPRASLPFGILSDRQKRYRSVGVIFQGIFGVYLTHQYPKESCVNTTKSSFPSTIRRALTSSTKNSSTFVCFCKGTRTVSPIFLSRISLDISWSTIFLKRVPLKISMTCTFLVRQFGNQEICVSLWHTLRAFLLYEVCGQCPKSKLRLILSANMEVAESIFWQLLAGASTHEPGALEERTRGF